MNRFRTERKATVCLAVTTFINQHVIHRSVLGSLICPRALAALYHHSIIVYLHVTALHLYIMAHIQVDGIAGWGAMFLCVARRNNALGGSIDEVIKVSHAFASVQMIGPERRVDEIHVLNRYVPAVREIYQTGAHRLQIGTSPIIHTSVPELFPIHKAVAVDTTLLSGKPVLVRCSLPICFRSVARDAEAVQSICINECGKVLQGLTFQTSLQESEVAYAVRPFYPSLNVKVGSLLKEQRTRQECSFRNNYHSAALAGTSVYYSLYGCRLHQRRIFLYAIFCYHVLLAKRLNIHLLGVAEESIHLCTVWPQRLLFLGFCADAEHHRQH